MLIGRQHLRAVYTEVGDTLGDTLFWNSMRVGAV